MRGGKNGSTQTQTCLSATFITTNPTRTELVSKQGLRGKSFLLKETAQLSQKISAILWTLEFHHRVNNSPPVVHIFSRINPAHILFNP